MSDLVIRNARLMTCDPEQPGLGIVKRGTVACIGGSIAWVGTDEQWPNTALALGLPVSKDGERTRRKTVDFPSERPEWMVIEGAGRLVTPGLIDCH
ncbi:MAG TPA: hypothetical protein VIU61_09320, partial [Kofleriaceae bacterium]